MWRGHIHVAWEVCERWVVKSKEVNVSKGENKDGGQERVTVASLKR